MTDDLKSKIARLGVNLAARPKAAESAVVLGRGNTERARIKNLAVRLNEADMTLLDELTLWARQSGLPVGWGTLLKAGLRRLRKDEPSLLVLRQIVRRDGRRRP